MGLNERRKIKELQDVTFPGRVKEIEEICGKHKVTLRQAAIQFAYCHPAVVSVVLGAVKPEEVKSNVHDAPVEIPAGLWSDLKSARLLDSAAPTKP